MADECDKATPQKEMQEFLNLQPEEIRTHLSIATAETVGQNYFLRIDKNTPDKFIPNMPKSAMPSENSSVARVTVAPTLLGCFIGYFRAEEDLVYSGFNNSKKEEFLGGYLISKIPFELAIKPSNAMVVDQSRSNEHWLVAYNEKNVEYIPIIIGKFFLSSVTYLNTGGKTLPALKVTCFLEVSQDDFDLQPGERLKAGYYRFELFEGNLHSRTVENENALRNLKELTKEEYFKQKKISADMLGRQEAPKYMNWK